MKMTKRLAAVLLTLILVVTTGMSVLAQEGTTESNGNKPFLALGADLTAEQKATVLSLMGLTEADLASCEVVYITNDMEHKYLDSYISPSVIGSKSLSSVLVRESSKGSGVVVTTKNITYCTTGMYRNALLTAGVQDAEILVVGPTQISGTAGLIGAIKAYEQMSGAIISEQTLDAALNELIATGELSADSINGQDIEELIAFVKAKLAAGDLKTEEDIRNAIEEGENAFNITLSQDEIDKIVDFMNKINELGLDPEALLNQAKDLYEKYGNDIFNNPEKAVGDMVKSSVGNFFKNIGDSIVNFFKGLFK